MGQISRILSLFLVGLAAALIGWGIMALASRIEHERRERHASKFGDEPARPPLPSWARLMSSWLMPAQDAPR
jgi:hypothetical protein